MTKYISHKDAKQIILRRLQANRIIFQTRVEDIEYINAIVPHPTTNSACLFQLKPKPSSYFVLAGPYLITKIIHTFAHQRVTKFYSIEQIESVLYSRDITPNHLLTLKVTPIYDDSATIYLQRL
jgi:hypothetical protein